MNDRPTMARRVVLLALVAAALAAVTTLLWPSAGEWAIALAFLALAAYVVLMGRPTPQRRKRPRPHRERPRPTAYGVVSEQREHPTTGSHTPVAH